MTRVILDSQNYLYTWLEGSAQCGKSVTAALAFALMIENSSAEDNLFIALGYTEGSARNNVEVCGGYGVASYFASRATRGKYQNCNCLYISAKTGTKILCFFGASTQSSNNAWHGWRVSGFLFDEIDRAHVNSIDEMNQRITTIEHPHIIVTQNPNIPKHPIYKRLEDLQNRGKVSYSHWTLDDNPAMTLAHIDEIKSRYDPAGIYYQRYILGLRVAPEGIIYHLDADSIIDSSTITYRDYIIVVDMGQTTSATSFVALARTYNPELKQNEVHVIKEYYHINHVASRDMKLPTDYYEDLAIFTADIISAIGKAPQRIIMDETSTGIMLCNKAMVAHHLGQIPLKFPYKEKEELRTQDGQNLIYTHKLRFDKACVHCIEEYNGAIYDEKKYEHSGLMVRSGSYTDEGHSDVLDSVEYGCTYYKNILNYV